MFGNRKDPMIDTVQKVMDENARRRQIEADLNEELGIQNRKQLGHEKHYLYDQALSQRINEAVLSPKRKSLLRGMKNEANEKPPFDPDPPRKKRPDEPTTARGLARKMMKEMMKKMKDKAAKDTQKTFPNVKHLTPAGNPDWHKHGYKDMPIKEEEQIVNERVLYSHSHSDTKVIRTSEKGDKEGSAIEVHKDGKKVATGDYDPGADAFFVNVGGKGQKSFDTAKDVANHFHDIKEEIRNNLLERANHLLENGSQDQIVEFMNDLTLEQRSILNMQEQLAPLAPVKPLAPVRPYVAAEPSKVPGVETFTAIGKALNPDNGPANKLTGSKNKAREAAVTREINKTTQQTVDQATKLSQTAGERLNNQFGAKPAPPPPATAAKRPDDTEYNRQKQLATDSAGKTASAFGSGTQTAAPAPVAAPSPVPAQASTVRSEVGASAQANVPDARPAPSPVSTADTGGDKYGSGNASAGFERGKYAAPDASDSSSGANELRSKQATADRGNLGESKTKYIPESITFERFLRNR